MHESVKHISKTVNSRHSQGYISSMVIVNCGRSILRDWTVSMRNRPYWHIYWNKTPGGVIIPASGEKIQMSPESLYLLPPYLVFATESHAVFEHFFIDFKLEDPSLTQLKREIISLPAASFLQKIEQCFSGKFTILNLGSLILSLLTAIPEQYFDNTRKQPTDSRILAALDLIDQAFQNEQVQSLDNRSISRKIGMSLDNFQHLFSQELKISPGRYVLNERLDKARIYLKSTELSIEEISNKTGFANRYQFTKAYSQHFHISPARFRKQIYTLANEEGNGFRN